MFLQEPTTDKPNAGSRENCPISYLLTKYNDLSKCPNNETISKQYHIACDQDPKQVT